MKGGLKEAMGVVRGLPCYESMIWKSEEEVGSRVKGRGEKAKRNEVRG